MNLDDPNEILLTPRYITQVTTEDVNAEDKPLRYKLQDLFLNYESLSPDEKRRNTFRVRMQVYKVDPTDLRECAVVLCNETGKTTSCKDLTGTGKL